MNQPENWVSFTESYEVSDQGRIRNKTTGKFRKASRNGSIELSGKSYRVARVVLTAFKVPRGSDTDVAIQINPEDGFKLSNLKWGTKQEAAVDWTKLRDIQTLAAKGLSIAEIRRRTGADYVTIKNAAPHALPAPRNGRPWSDDKKFQVGQLVADGASLNDITRTLGVDHRTIKKYFPNAGWRNK